MIEWPNLHKWYYQKVVFKMQTTRLITINSALLPPLIIFPKSLICNLIFTVLLGKKINGTPLCWYTQPLLPFDSQLNQRSCTLESKELEILSICTWFLTLSSLKFRVDELDFSPSLNWIFTAFVACKNPVQTRKKNPVHQTRNFKLKNIKNQVQILR